jgi:S-adenosyl-L-methionine hydrolase (adenosine-forming)
VTIITLTTDFGAADGYVGAMKGVILGITPGATLVDISHDVAAHDVRGGAFVLKTASPYFAAGTIHIAVIDPGVGSERRALAVQTPRATFIGPDNGVLSWALAREDGLTIVHLDRPAYWLDPISSTFHGRDVFAPAAAHLARGVGIAELGTVVDDLIRLPLPRPRCDESGTLHSEVIYIDRFGNLVTGIEIEPGDGPAVCRVTNLPDGAPVVNFSSLARIDILGRRIEGVVHSYSDVNPGELLALAGSSGHLEVAVRNGNAASALEAQAGAPVRVIWPA